MHVLFVHKNFPAQFGHVAVWLIKQHGWQCSYVSELPEEEIAGIRRIRYTPAGGAKETTHYLSRTFENQVAHAQGVFEACKAARYLRPDLIVGHSGFGSTLFLPELWPGVPIINYFELYYHTRDSDVDFRPDFPIPELHLLRVRARNAMLLLDLQTCAAGYAPTEWQRSRFPAEYLPKLECIFDGIDREFWHRRENLPRVVGGREIPPGTRIVTYVSRGFESMRGFDIFMKVAARICEARSDVVFAVVGSDRICYGGDESYIREKTFREHVLKNGHYDLSRFIFTGKVPPAELRDLFAISDLHIYLTVPFVLSWSLMNALACGCTVLGSDTPPVREMIRHEENGLLAGFFDIDALTREALRVLEDPPAFRQRLGAAGEAMIDEKYALTSTLPRMVELFERVKNRR